MIITITAQSVICANNCVHYGLNVVFTCLHIAPSHYHHYADFLETTEHTKCLSGMYFVQCVSTIKAILSLIFFTTYGAVCYQLITFVF